MLAFVRPALDAATPVLLRSGAAAWGFTASAASFVVAASTVYVVGRTSTHLMESGVHKLGKMLVNSVERLNDDLKSTLETETAKKKAFEEKVADTKAAADKANFAAAVELEIARLIRLGELQKSPVVAESASFAGAAAAAI